MAEPTAADVQEELQEYLNSKNINALFIQVRTCLDWACSKGGRVSYPCSVTRQIVERLLIEKPDNPIAFMVEYLQKTYPDQASVVYHTTMNDR
jgi:cAMP-dependent protein kinase regulator